MIEALWCIAASLPDPYGLGKVRRNMNLAEFWSGDQCSQSNASTFPVFHKEKVLCTVWMDFVCC